MDGLSFSKNCSENYFFCLFFLCCYPLFRVRTFAGKYGSSVGNPVEAIVLTAIAIIWLIFLLFG
jgi:hypothetical protein